MRELTAPQRPESDDSIRAYADAGYDLLSLHHVGDDQEGFIRFLTGEVMPALG